MDRETLLAHLESTEKLVAATALRVAEQREFVEELKRRGRDIQHALATLEIFESVFLAHEANRDWLVGKLAEARQTEWPSEKRWGRR